VIASPFVTHRDERFFPDPLQFKPERWLSDETDHEAIRETKQTRPRLAYFPFGAGPRACIGEGFAWMEGTLVLATLAQRWRLTRPADAAFHASPRITLRPQAPVEMTPQRRLDESYASEVAV
jgi:cytochrome P450